MSITPQYIAAAVVASDQIAQLFTSMPGRDCGGCVAELSPNLAQRNHSVTVRGERRAFWVRDKLPSWASQCLGRQRKSHLRGKRDGIRTSKEWAALQERTAGPPGNNSNTTRLIQRGERPVFIGCAGYIHPLINRTSLTL